MNKLTLKTSLLSVTTVLLLSITGCGGGDSASSDIVTDTVSYAGTAVVSGTIDTSSLSSADQSLTRSRSRMSRDAVTEVVKLYVIDANGEEVDANIDCTIDTTGAYECPDVKNGQDFITRYVKDIGNGQVLEMKAPVSVPLTGDPAPVKVDPITTMVVSAIAEAVTKAITGVTSDAALIETILASVTSAITDAMNELFPVGTEPPSMVVEADFTAIQTDEETEILVNDKLSDAVGIVNSSDEVENVVSAVKNEATADQFAEATPEEQMIAVFKVLGWEEGMPSWVLALFSGEFNNVQSVDPETNATSPMTFKKFFAANVLVPVTAEDLASGDKFNVLTNLYTEAEVVAIATDIAAEINPTLTDGTIFADMMAEVSAYHTAKAKPLADRTDADLEFMAHFNPTIAEVFPAAFVETADFNTTTIDDMAQLMLVLGYLDPRDGSIAELVAEKVKVILDADAKQYFDTQLNHVSESLYSDDKESLLATMFTQATMAKYDEISVGWMNARSQPAWDNETATNNSALSFETSLDKLDWDNTIPSEVLGDITATLTYPTLSGTSTTTLNYNAERGAFTIEPYVSTSTSVATTSTTTESTSSDVQSENLITDFVSGDYTVSFTYAGQTYSKTKEFFFIPNAQDYYATLTTPKGQPRYENEWMSFYTNPGDFNASETIRIEAEIAAYDIASNEYWMNGAPTMAPNTDTTNNDVNDTLTGMIVKWEAPNLDGVTLPENVSVAYSLQVNLYEPKITADDGTNECWTNWAACNTEIYNSWNEDKLITSTSITLPVALKVNENTDATLYEKSQYSLNVNVLFIDKTTGREIAHGGGAWTQFIVGESVALSGNEVITAKGTVSLNEWEYFDGTQTVTETSALPANFKIALIADTWAATSQDADGNDIWSSTKEKIALGDFNATSKTFEVSTTWGDLEAKLSHNTNIQVIGFSDDNNDSVFNDYNHTTGEGENSYYINGGMWINTYGDKIINVDTYHDNGEYENNSYRLKTDENVTIEGLDIKIW